MKCWKKCQIKSHKMQNGILCFWHLVQKWCIMSKDLFIYYYFFGGCLGLSSTFFTFLPLFYYPVFSRGIGIQTHDFQHYIHLSDLTQSVTFSTLFHVTNQCRHFAIQHFVIQRFDTALWKASIYYLAHWALMRSNYFGKE